VIADAALATGFDVRRSEVHGMSQRGGSVVSQVRYGARVHSPLIARGTADVLVSLELLEAVRHLEALRSDGVLLASEQRITPAPLGSLIVRYPEDARALCEERVARCAFIPAMRLARQLGEEKAANMVMLGAFQPRFIDANRRAFQCGREHMSSLAPVDP
jgi:indolepyruvate ferredoxin oxidoreductase beta subunit